MTLNYGTPEERFYLDRFLAISAPWFSQYVEPDFFNKLLPQRSWSHPALKHSIVALAMATESARRTFAPSEFAYSYERHQARHHWHYARALQEVYRAGDISEDVVLLTSAVFWLHENLTKSSRTAMVHLQGFLRMITERKVRRKGLPGNEEDEWESTILRGLVFRSAWDFELTYRMLTNTYSADVADEAFAETLEPDLMKNIRQRLNDPMYARKFKQLKHGEARDELRLGLSAIPYSTLVPSGAKRQEYGPISTTELRRYFERWYRTFSSLPSHPIDKILFECHYVCVALSVQVHEYGQKPTKATDPQSTQRMEYILSLLESIDFQALQQPPLGEDVEMPIIPILTQLIVLSSTDEIRWRAFRILRTMNRIEGLWSSDVVADMIAIAYPPTGGEGPWSRHRPNQARLKPFMESDEAMIALRDDNGLASYAQQDEANGVVHLPESYGRVSLGIPPESAAARRARLVRAVGHLRLGERVPNTEAGIVEEVYYNGSTRRIVDALNLTDASVTLTSRHGTTNRQPTPGAGGSGGTVLQPPLPSMNTGLSPAARQELRSQNHPFDGLGATRNRLGLVYGPASSEPDDSEDEMVPKISSTFDNAPASNDAYSFINAMGKDQFVEALQKGWQATQDFDNPNKTAHALLLGMVRSANSEKSDEDLGIRRWSPAATTTKNNGGIWSTQVEASFDRPMAACNGAYLASIDPNGQRPNELASVLSGHNS